MCLSDLWPWLEIKRDPTSLKAATHDSWNLSCSASRPGTDSCPDTSARRCPSHHRLFASWGPTANSFICLGSGRDPVPFTLSLVPRCLHKEPHLPPQCSEWGENSCSRSTEQSGEDPNQAGHTLAEWRQPTCRNLRSNCNHPTFTQSTTPEDVQSARGLLEVVDFTPERTSSNVISDPHHFQFCR